MEKENIIEENNSNHSEDLEEEKVGEKYNTEELKEEDKIFKVLLDLHEDVPLEDPGPNTANEDKGEGAAGAGATQDLHEDVPLEDPGPNTADEDKGEGAAGATQ